MNEHDRSARAESYVLGRMDEMERARAERDMERDPEFLDAVMRLASEIRAAGARRAPTTVAWDNVSEQLSSLPQMANGGEKPAAASIVPGRSPAEHLGPASLGGRRGMILALLLIAAFGLGFVAGRIL